MIAAYVMIHTYNTTFKQTEAALNAVCRNHLSILKANVFFLAMIHPRVLASCFHALQYRRCIGHKVGILRNHLVNDRSEILRCYFFNMIRPHLATTLH